MSAIALPAAPLDAALPTMPLALDAAVARRELRRSLGEPTELHAVRLVRHKPGRRCLVEYDIERRGERLTLVAKIRRKRSGRSGAALATALWDAGLHAGNADRIAVPQPYGHVPALKAWLQRKVAGVPLTDALTCELMARAAHAAHSVHAAGVPATRAHALADELAILHARLAPLTRRRHGRRVLRLLAACDRVAAAVPAPKRPCGIHRDFYPDQLVVDGDRLWVLDFDLYCLGDPALDAGNFLGHLTEQALRELGDPEALAACESAFEDAFAAHAGDAVRPAVRAYANLTLARHVALSTELAGRGHLTGALLDLCAERMER